MPKTAMALDRVLAELEADMSSESGAAFLDLVTDYFESSRSGDGPVSSGISYDAAAARFAEPLPREGRPLSEVSRRLGEQIVPDANRLYHPMYLGHQVSAPLPAAIWTEMFISALNQSLAVREMSPTVTPLEHRVVRWMCDLVGFGPASGGTLTSGGTEATFAALLAARSRAIPDVWENGLRDHRPVVLCGEHAHYAVARAVGEMGLGLRSVIAIPSRDHRMDVDVLAARLEALKAEGRTVMAVVATAGSTATGSFDDLTAIGEICAARGIWFHVDGAHGASALLSETHRHRLRGLELADSLAWDPHKMMLLPLSAGMVLVRDERSLEAAFAQKAPYLFHGDGNTMRNPDQGIRSFQCSRRSDVLKVWVALQRYGADGIGLLQDHLCALTSELHALLVAHEEFEPLHEPESNILCFRWLGAGSERTEAELDALNGALRDRYNASGRGWITSTVLDGRRVLRVTIMNPRTRSEHIERLVDGLVAESREL